VEFGQFSRRGGLLDIWPPTEPFPLRLEFFGDVLDTLRSFDPSSQRSMRPADRLLICPAREFILPQDAREIENPCEFHLPLLHPSPASLLDYLPPDALVLIDNLHTCEDTIAEIEEQALGLRQDALEEGIIDQGFPLPYLSWDEIVDALPPRCTLELGPVSGTQTHPLSQAFTPNPRFGGRLKPLMDYVIDLGKQGEPVYLVSRQASRLENIWKQQPSQTRKGCSAPLFLQGSLSDGWQLTSPEGTTVHLITDGEVFGWRRPQPRKRHRPVTVSPEAAFADMQSGDWVVHVDHGIGRFLGLVQRTIDGDEREYLCVEYAQGDQLFVPIYQADRLTRYIGPDNRPPTPTRLGGIAWQTTKSRVREAVEKVAIDLLDLYARRLVARGHAFSPDTPWQQELEGSFPYIETPDQLQAIEEVKRDMETPRPMDRLMCGDVGYGKTEVALRAAFKAVMDGKQVAVLVPTTVLAQQHYHTFRERLAAFPVEVEMLSRFRTPQQQKEILFRLEKGVLDIVIGTHRLLSKDVKFKNLGLLIIDEEQRFGVTHKEQLKQFRTEVDVLTLTATPIPRTLYMALTGVRDISTINTPPEERLPVITHVCPYDPRLIRRAILREIERGGQVFFVHNRVQTIPAMYQHLKKLIPQARIAIAHGQMPEDELSQVMERFTAGEVDVLLSTSIIESGLDIPNANTLIVDRADTFGLAQLYQLRGRVGRGAQRAYAYFFSHRKKPPTREGRMRLETIAEHPDLGAGFSIAMRDLEIRGAGDLLGTRQHGHIAAVGFHLYTRLLAEAVQRLREEYSPLIDAAKKLEELPSAVPPRVNVDLPLPIQIPSDYIPDKAIRLGLYRRIAEVRSIADLEAFVAELEDRFGPAPEPVHHLLYQLKVKILAQKAGLQSVHSENGQIALRYPPLPEETAKKELPPISPYVRSGKNAYWLKLEGNPQWETELLEVLYTLAGKPLSEAA
jgi:transcription-repair coupling factor (superfamily II helicase)